MDVSVLPEGQDWVDGAARAVGDALSSVDEDRRLNLGLAGGSTPEPVYARLRDEPVPWDRVDLWLSDERWVPPDHEASNGRMVAVTLGDHVPAVLHRPRWTNRMDAEDSAAFYDALLHQMFHDGRADVVLLGMGDDGHTASLFPGTEALGADPWRWFVANFVPRLGDWRLTSTARLLTAARRVLVLVAGEGKASTLAEVLEGPDDRYPIQVLRHCEGDVTWILDEAAASRLTTAG